MIGMMEGVNTLKAAALLLSLCLTGCQWESPSRPSVIIIAVESLGFSLVPCQSVEFEASPSGLRTLCDESVRFTHAFTPSVLSQSALTSLLTARYPHEHGVRQNGSDFLSSTVETVAEAAQRRRYMTAFISGGPPMWSKSGLTQGIDFYDDRVKIDLHRIYRPVQESFKVFLSWLDSDVGSRPYLSVIYVPDLQYPHAQTLNDMGEPRERSLQSQIRELDESLHFLIQQLRKRNLWEKTHVIVTGLNGYSAERRHEEHKGISLHSENTQVTLFIKPAGKKRDLAMNWKIDSNISLVDVGATLFDIMGLPIPDVPSRQLSIRSLKGVLEGRDFADADDRLILSESAWSTWHKQGGGRYAVRRGEYLLLWENHPRIFNTLTDRFELTPLAETDAKAMSFRQEAFQLLRDKQLTPWTPPETSFNEKIAIASELWAGQPPTDELLADVRRLLVKRPQDEQLVGWLAIWYMRFKKWPEFSKLAKKAKNPIWEYVANRNLGKAVRAPESLCFQYVGVRAPLFQRVFPKKCEDDVFGLFLSWINAADDRSRELYRERFFRQYRNALIDQEIAEQNYANGLMWDVPDREPAAPSLTELALSLPENAKYIELIRRRLATDDVASGNGLRF